MARLQGISGGMSGRTGSFTYRQSRGQTIVSQYQPIVKNPNTEGQQTQRAKFKLLSQLAAIMKDGFGTMGINERPARQRPTQRNAFMKINMAAVEGSTSEAKIRLEAVKLTTSNTPLGSISVNAETSTVTIVGIAKNVASVRFVEMGTLMYEEVDQSTGQLVQKYRPMLRKITDVPVTNGQVSIDPTDDGTVLAYGLIPSSSLTGVDFNEIHTPEDETFIAAIKLNQMVAEGTMSETMTLGVNVTLN